jgi:hypothetical protein
MKRHIVLASLGILILTNANARVATPAALAGLAKLDDAFTRSCVRAFSASAGEASGPAAQEICGCTAKESHHQGVTRQALEKETRRITRDPKYQIQDDKLMNAFRWCTLESMQKAGLDSHAANSADEG